MAYYYMRTRPKAETQQFTIDPEFAKKKRSSVAVLRRMLIVVCCVWYVGGCGSVDGCYYIYIL
jgi:hypothetical protein